MKYEFRRISRLRIAAWLVVLVAVGIAAVGIRIGAAIQSSSRNEGRESSPSPSNGTYSSGTSNVNSNKSYASEPSSSIPAARPNATQENQQRVTPLPALPQSDSSYRDYEAETLRTEIEKADQSLNILKSEIDSLEEDMAPYKVQIDKYAAVMKRMERDHDLGLSIDQDEYDRALRYHNYNVDLYNSKLAERREKASEYNAQLRQQKTKIDRYNVMIKGTR
jgi:chromosome segregation ATPase